MCRIVGRVSKEDKSDFDKGLKSMLTSVAHGGPDDEGTYMDGGVALGHRRLSIIDLSKAGHQPMMTESSDIVISYNGEIYNYLDLKKELEGEGFTFRTKTDTEVILKAYQCWGPKAFDRMEGIFAFALYDKKQELFFLVRDHIGVKPLYYFLDENELLFSSEVRAFKALRNNWKESEDWKILFLAFGSIPHPYTTLSQVVQLDPGSYLQLNLKNFTHQVKFYYQFNSCDYTIQSSHDALVLMQSSSLKALQKNLISDAPLGIFLSGGIDSSLLTLLADKLMNHVKTISVNFDDAKYDETHYQKLVLKKTENVEHIAHRVTERMFWERLDDIWNAMDQPSIDGVNAYFVTRCAKNDGIKTVLSGLGADEIFGGYLSFGRIKWMRWFRQLPFRKSIARLARVFKKSWGRLIYLALPGPIGDYLFLRGIYTPDEIASLLNVPASRVWEVLQKVPFEAPAKMNDVEYASLLEAKIYMTNQLLKDTDCMGMWHGVEVRVPFLDIEMLKKVHAIPPSIRYNSRRPKYLLTASNQEVLPREIVFREKKGFTFPFALWMKRSKKQFRELLPAGKETNWVCDDFEKGRAHWSKCWSLAVLQQFK
jgi:asparagine synthase (glutamine-hydrolysing)